MIVILQGTEYRREVKNKIAVMTISDGFNRYSITNVIQENGKYYLIADNEITKTYAPGKYRYQIIDGNEFTDEGVVKIKANLAYSDSPYSYWEKVLHAIDDRLAGKAEDPTNTVSVGDKSLSYYSINDLITLREFVLKRIDEEKAEEQGRKDIKNGQKTIHYVWR